MHIIIQDPFGCERFVFHWILESVLILNYICSYYVTVQQFIILTCLTR